MRFHYASRLAGDGTNHIDLRSGSLSWSEHRALLNTAAAAVETSQATTFMAEAIHGLHYDLVGLTSAIDRMEQDLVLRLDAQTVLLRTEVELLANIAEALRTPRATRAAERIADAGSLLDDNRYERALVAAEEAIQDDPTNRSGFVAAGWALLGLERVDEARSFFREAAQCGKGDGAHSALRQAARLTFLLAGPEEALKELHRGLEMDVSSLERAGADYDRVVYYSAAGRSGEAIERLRSATCEDRSFCLMALTDAVASRDEGIVRAAVGFLSELDGLEARFTKECKAVQERLAPIVDVLDTPGDSDRSDQWKAVNAFISSEWNWIDTALGEAATWGFTRLHAALDTVADGPAEAANKASKYIAEQRTMVQALHDRAQRLGAVAPNTPTRDGDGWSINVMRLRGMYQCFHLTVDPGGRVQTYKLKYGDSYPSEIERSQSLSQIRKLRRSPLPWPYLDAS